MKIEINFSLDPCQVPGTPKEFDNGPVFLGIFVFESPGIVYYGESKLPALLTAGVKTP